MSATCAAWMTGLPYTAVSVVDDAPETITLRIAPVDVGIARPAPGQFVMVWAFGVGEVPISVSGADGITLDLTIRNAGATSAALTRVRPGELVGVRGPYGVPWPLERVAGRHVAVVAGGLGFAPLRTAVDALLTGADRPAALHLVIGARTPRQLLGLPDVERWRAHPGVVPFGVAIIVDADDEGGTWHGPLGTVTEALDEVTAPIDLAFVCGPERMMLATGRHLVARGVPAADVYVSLERNMHCGISQCGRCQLGAALLCRDGPVIGFDQVHDLMAVAMR